MTSSWTDVIERRSVPIVIISHNQLSGLQQLLGWLVATGHERITLLDNASTFDPLLAFLDTCEHEVIRLRSNLGHTSPWASGLVNQFDGPFVVTDPDILPDPETPSNATEYFQELLLRHNAFDKAGFGLLLDDLPERYPHREVVRSWEAPYWQTLVEPGVYAAHIDTTFAVHRPGTQYKVTEALRTARPYVARHLPWYGDPSLPDEETAHFFGHRRDDIGYWNRVDLPPDAHGLARPNDG
jgi:hypothetical protein